MPFDSRIATILTAAFIGFGTGLNLLLLADLAEQYEVSRPIFFTSVEAFPMKAAQISSLNYADFMRHRHLAAALPDIFDQLHAHQSATKEAKPVSGRLGRVAYHIFPCTFDAFSKQDLSPHIPAFTHIKHDPFDPQVSPELWSPEVFSALKDRSASTAVLTTYGASTAARASMAVGGWLPARAPGALGKREMTVAALQADTPVFSGYKRLNENRLRQRYEAGDFSR